MAGGAAGREVTEPTVYVALIRQRPVNWALTIGVAKYPGW